MRSFRLSPEAYRRVTLFALLALGFIIVTGGAVRLTGSGLGCSDWPTCENDRLVAPLELHPMVEFVNRTITGLVSLAVMLAVLGSLVRVPRRRDLTLLSFGLVGGVVAQIVLGGLTVLFHLWPPLVMAHLGLSLVLVANALVLHHRAGQPDGQIAWLVAPEVRTLSRWLLVAVSLVVVTGTVVTGSGPHGGDEDVDRLPFFVPDVARIHGLSVMLFLGAVLGFLWLLGRTGAPAAVHRAAQVLLTVAVAQAGVGYTQYFTGVPVLLVGVHILGAVLVFAATVRLHLSLTTPPRHRPARPLMVQFRTMSTLSPVEVDQPTGDVDEAVDRPWIVLVWNDPINLMSYVTFVFQKLFGYSLEKATALMLDVHQKGRAVVSNGTREKAELDVFRLHEHGLWATMQHDK